MIGLLQHPPPLGRGGCQSVAAGMHGVKMGECPEDFSICEILPDGPQNTNYGCMVGLTRLVADGRDIIVTLTVTVEVGVKK